MAHSADNDLLEFAPDEAPPPPRMGRRWKVLVVDDDVDVHQATELALGNVLFDGGELQLIRAQSVPGAVQALNEHPDVAVAILDVVMESDQAGLELVRLIRNDLGLRKLRIVLRTGQPGFAPEIDAIRDFDINDYRTKSELTRAKLHGSLITALRSYQQIDALDQARLGLQRILAANSALIREADLVRFACAAVVELAALLGVEADGVVCALPLAGAGQQLAEPRVVGGAGAFVGLPGQALGAVDDVALRELIERCIAQQRSQFLQQRFALFLGQATGEHLVIGLCGTLQEGGLQRHLLEVFEQNLAMCAGNVRMVERLRETAYVDGLLKIPNRSALTEAVDAWQADPRALPGHMVLVDIDAFSEINETFGDRFGDGLLMEVSDRLRQRFGATALVARIANDTFGVLGAAEQLGPESLAAVFAEPFMVENVGTVVSASFGAVPLNAGVDSGAAAIKFGYSALKRARGDGPGCYALYSSAVGTEIKERTRLLQGLRAAFDQQRLFLAYQPQIDAANGAVLGFEALMRWRTEQGALVPPDRFIPIAEQSGLIRELGAWALRMALHTVVRLGREGFPGLRMAVNISVAQVISNDFEALVESALSASGCPPEQVEIEITESVAMQSPEVVIRKLESIRRLGVSVAIDDFGTGFSSLSYLERLAVDRLKIDRSFTIALDEDRGGARIAEMVIDLGKTLGLKVIAEGVETLAQRDRLVSLGCHELQGYLFSPPMPAERMVGWLRDYRPA